VLAAVDAAHDRLSGPTQKLLYQAYYEFGDVRYQRPLIAQAASLQAKSAFSR